MKKYIRPSSLISVMSIIGMLASPLLLFSQLKTINADNLIRQSDVIVQGSVKGRMAEWTPKHDKIQTRIVIGINQLMKGTVQGNSMTVVVPGGEVDGVGEWYSHVPRFDNDEEVVLFAKQDKGGVYRVAEGEAGKFTVTIDSRTRSKVISNIGTLDAFSNKIKSTVKLQQAGDGNQQ
ncbi:MAG: hypothetical protein ACHQQQ_07115 [Bacteroidota bacterium]